MLEERLADYSFDEHSARWDDLKTQVDKVVQDLKESENHMDLVDLMCKDQRQMKAPKPKTIVNDLQEIYEFLLFNIEEHESVRIATKHLIFRWAAMLASSSFVASTSRKN